MNRTDADRLLESSELVACLETTIPQAMELERQLLTQDIPVLLAGPPKKTCCAGACGCASRLQLLVREEDVERVGGLFHSQWLEAVRREGTLAGAGPATLPRKPEGAEPACPACGFEGALTPDGACADCGLQLDA